MKLSEWADKKGISYVTALRWYKSNLLPAGVKAHKTPSGTILIEDDDVVTEKEAIVNYGTNRILPVSVVFRHIYNALPNDIAYVAAENAEVKKALYQVAGLIAESKEFQSLNSPDAPQQSVVKEDPYETVRDKLFEEMAEVLDSKLAALFINYTRELGTNPNIEEDSVQPTNPSNTEPYSYNGNRKDNIFRPIQGREFEPRKNPKLNPLFTINNVTNEVEINKNEAINQLKELCSTATIFTKDETIKSIQEHQASIEKQAAKLDFYIKVGIVSVADLEKMTKLGLSKDVVALWQSKFGNEPYTKSIAKAQETASDNKLVDELQKAFDQAPSSRCAIENIEKENKERNDVQDIFEAANAIGTIIEGKQPNVEMMTVNGYEIPKDPDELRNIMLPPEVIKKLDVAKKALEAQGKVMNAYLGHKYRKITEQFQSKETILLKNEFVRAKLDGSEIIDALIDMMIITYTHNTNALKSLSPGQFNKELTRITGKLTRVEDNVMTLFSSFMEEQDKIAKETKRIALREALSVYIPTKEKEVAK